MCHVELIVVRTVFWHTTIISSTDVWDMQSRAYWWFRKNLHLLFVFPLSFWPAFFHASNLHPTLSWWAFFYMYNDSFLLAEVAIARDIPLCQKMHQVDFLSFESFGRINCPVILDKDKKIRSLVSVREVYWHFVCQYVAEFFLWFSLFVTDAFAHSFPTLPKSLLPSANFFLVFFCSTRRILATPFLLAIYTAPLFGFFFPWEPAHLTDPHLLAVDWSLQRIHACALCLRDFHSQREEGEGQEKH